MIRKRKSKKTRAKEQKSRAKYKCPEELEVLIEIANLLPPRTGFMSVERLRLTFPTDRSDSDYDPSQDPNNPFADRQITLEIVFSEYQIISRLKQRARHFPVLYTYLFHEDIFEAITRHREMSELKLQLEKIAGVWDGYKKQKEKEPGVTYAEIFERATLGRDLIDFLIYERNLDVGGFFKAPFSVDADGALTTQYVHGEPLLQQFNRLVSEKKIKYPERIRTCEICERVFWAVRYDQETCKSACANTLRVRRSRTLTDEEKAERKSKREANRELIKNGTVKPNKRGKNNGTL
jgi:hypothetical protein